MNVTSWKVRLLTIVSKMFTASSNLGKLVIFNNHVDLKNSLLDVYCYDVSNYYTFRFINC